MKKDLISRNIGLLMEHFKIKNESQLAKEVGMPQTTINKLINGTTADPRVSTLTPLIEYFNISFDTLLNENPRFNENDSVNIKQNLIPVILYEELLDMHESISSLNISNWPYWVPITKQNEKDYYAIQVKSKQLLSPFEEASLLIVKDNDKLHNNDYCIVEHLKTKSISLKKVLIDNGKQWLLALKKDLSTLEFCRKEWKLLGIIQTSLTDWSRGEFLLNEDKNE